MAEMLLALVAGVTVTVVLVAVVRAAECAIRAVARLLMTAVRRVFR